jgi:hypothetical protein
LISSAETRIYLSLDLLPYPLHVGHHIDPALAKSGHRPTPLLYARAKELGDPVVTPNGRAEYDLLQGSLRFFARLFDAVPERRKWVREVYVDCSQILPNRMDVVGRTVRSIGVLKAVKKLTIFTDVEWEESLRMILGMTPNIDRLNLIVSGTRPYTVVETAPRATTARPSVPLHRSARTLSIGNPPPVLDTPRLKMPRIPTLKHLAIEGMQHSLERVVIDQIKSAKPLESLVLMDWAGSWNPITAVHYMDARGGVSVAVGSGPRHMLNALVRTKGFKTMFLPILCFNKMQPKQLRNTLVLGVQGDYLPTLRFTVSVVGTR